MCNMSDALNSILFQQINKQKRRHINNIKGQQIVALTTYIMYFPHIKLNIYRIA